MPNPEDFLGSHILDPEKSCLKQPVGKEESQREEGCASVAQTRRQVGIASGQFTLGGGSGSDIYNPSGPQWLVAGPTHQTGATYLASILCWSLATGLWHRTRRKIFVFRVFSPPPLLLSSAFPNSKHLISFFLNPGDSNPSRLLDLPSLNSRILYSPLRNCCFGVRRHCNNSSISAEPLVLPPGVPFLPTAVHFSLRISKSGRAGPNFLVLVPTSRLQKVLTRPALDPCESLSVPGSWPPSSAWRRPDAKDLRLAHESLRDLPPAGKDT